MEDDMFPIPVLAGLIVAFMWIACGLVNAHRAERDELLHPMPEFSGIGAVAVTLAGPFGYRMVQRH